MQLSDQQLSVIEQPLTASIFLSGPAGSGKTTAAIERVHFLVENGAEGRKILLFFPQRNLGSSYQKRVQSPSFPGSSFPVSATYGGLARRLIDLFWPSVIQNYSSFDPSQPPTFLTLESSLYFLSGVVEPLILEEGYFSNVAIQRNRLYSQILDNLNKAAINGYPHTEISQRLISSWIGDPSHESVFLQAQEAANKFRELCLERNLLDYSLQIELFTRMVSDMPLVRSYLQNQYAHLIYDNAEEDIPVSHDLIRLLIPNLTSVLVIFDQDAGYRSFLGASPESGYQLSSFCETKLLFKDSFTTPPSLTAFNQSLIQAIDQDISPSSLDPAALDQISINYFPFYPVMAEWIALKISDLLAEGTEPGKIVVLAPFLSDSLRFMISREFDKRQLPYTSHRPSRALRDEPVTQCLLALGAIAHPEWEIYPSVYELALAFMQAFKELDLTRADLLARGALTTLRSERSGLRLAPFDTFPADLQDRISFFIGGQYQELLTWLQAYRQDPPLALDFFFSRLFGEFLTRPDFGFHNDLEKGRVTSQIIDSFSKFRRTAANIQQLSTLEAGREYCLMVRFGVLANQYLRSWVEAPADKVLLSPAYTFLLNNRPVDYQFWLDIGSRGWYERIYQPLTNPHVLHRDWESGKYWTDTEESLLNNSTLTCITTGLIRRCGKEIFGCLTETDERGYDQKGLLIQALNTLSFHLRDGRSGRGGTLL